jgi:hypothetical protein
VSEKPLGESTPIRLGFVVTLCVSLAGAGYKIAELNGKVSDDHDRILRLEAFREEVIADRSANALRMQKFEDTLEHLVETVERIDKKLEGRKP